MAEPLVAVRTSTTPATASPPDPFLTAADPAGWLEVHLAARRAQFEAAYAEVDATTGADVRTLADLVDGGGLADLHARLLARGTPPATAATYLAAWFGGTVAEVVGYGLVAGECGFLARAGALRWHLHSEGWPTGVELEPRAVVAPGHPWEGLDGVEVDEPDARAVEALVEACRPLVDACRSLAPVGRTGLWNEIGDALGNVLAFQFLVPPTPGRVERLAALVDRPGVPWRARPRLGFARSSALGTVHVAQKGGCCLAYRSPRADADDPYCSTCSFRDAADCDARQVRWLEATAAAGCGDDLGRGGAADIDAALDQLARRS